MRLHSTTFWRKRLFPSYSRRHVVRLETFVREAFIKKEHITAVFFDLEKAYDTTWKYGIMRDLRDFGLKDRLPLLIIFYQIEI